MGEYTPTCICVFFTRSISCTDSYMHGETPRKVMTCTYTWQECLLSVCMFTFDVTTYLYKDRPLGKSWERMSKEEISRPASTADALAPRAGLRASFPTPPRSPRPRSYAQVMARWRIYWWGNLLALYNPSRLPRAHDEEREHEMIDSYMK
jgi:hypothetical protein